MLSVLVDPGDEDLLRAGIRSEHGEFLSRLALPKDLLAAFKATLEEIEQSDLLIHLADASSPLLENQLASVNRILEELQLSEIPRLLIFNKADLVEDQEQLENQAHVYGAMIISAMDRSTLAPLVEAVSARLTSEVSGAAE